MPETEANAAVAPDAVAPTQSDPTAEATHTAVISLPNSGSKSAGLLDFLDPRGIPSALAILLVAMLVVSLVRRSVRGVAERWPGRRLLFQQSATFIAFATYAVATGLAASRVIDLSSGAVLALSGTLAVAAGFILKDAGSSLIATLSILVNRPFQVGDRIQFGEYYGEVTSIGLSAVSLKTLGDNMVTIPSWRFLSDPVSSANAGELECMVEMPFYLDPGTDHDAAQTIVRDAVLSSRFLYLGKPINLLLGMRLVDNLGAVVELTAKAYVFDTRREKDFATDVTDRVLLAFRHAGIRCAGARDERGERVATPA